MSRFDVKKMQLLSAGVALAAAPLLSAHAEYRCDAPPSSADARACAAATQGPVELRRFVERTRVIYGLYYGDYKRPESDATAAQPRSDRSAMAIPRHDTGGRATKE
ncbi:MAG: hypothetical protein WKH97_11485 [Casimicrobiaceae bacterium]